MDRFNRREFLGGLAASSAAVVAVKNPMHAEDAEPSTKGETRQTS